ncbi:MAG TPA: hypothetical protein VNR64_00820 [Vicinamibacterales bacterium]|nr:hypothetical protein [Vicinamibacterales bacterium]
MIAAENIDGSQKCRGHDGKKSDPFVLDAVAEVTFHDGDVRASSDP